MRHLKTLLPLLALTLLLGGCAGEYGQSSIAPVTDFADTIHGLYRIVTIWSVVILVVVWALLAYVLIRFRERPDSEKPRQIHGHLGLEIAWTVVPALIVVAIAIPTVQAIFASQRGDPENALVVEVVGHQFWWEFRYPETGVVTANELHLPVGRPVSLRLHSADVIHSFWIPQLGGKRDVNPRVARPEGEDLRYNWLHFTIREPGVYLGQCAEFCGESHSLMGARVIAESPEEFEAWMAEWQEGPPPVPEDEVADPDTVGGAGSDTLGVVARAAELPAGLDPAVVEQGRQIFHSQSCIACHGIEGTNAQGRVGPDLTLLGQRAHIASGWLDNSVESLERWIEDPQSVKPGALMPGVDRAGGNWPATGLSDEQVTAVAQYLYSLR